MNNKMLSGLALLCAALLSQSANAGDCMRERVCAPKHKRHYCNDKKHPFFVTVGTGASWSAGKKVHVDHVTAAADATTKFWDGANEGYDKTHGTSEFYTLALGYHWSDWFSSNVELTHRPSYKYRKNQTQTAPDNVNGLEALGAKTRYFDLKETSITFNVDLRSGGLFDWCSWQCGDNWKFQLLIGGGIGISYNRVENFHSITTSAVSNLVGRAPQALTGATAGTAAANAGAGTRNGAANAGDATVLSAEHALIARDVLVLGDPSTVLLNQAHSIMLDRTKSDFVWQLKIGFEVAYKRCSFDIFYRYHDAGKFHSHNYTVDVPANFASPAKVQSWKGDMTAHELCFNMNKRF